jgi:hypothetical protein
VRGGKVHAANRLGRDGGVIRPGTRLVSAGIAALAVGFAFGLQAMRPSVSVSESIHPKNFDGWVSPGSQSPDTRAWRLASLDTVTVFDPAAEDGARQPEWTPPASVRLSATEGSPQSTLHAASFDERFSGEVDWLGSHQIADQTNSILVPSPDLGGHSAARRAGAQSARSLASVPASPPASIARKPVRVADASEDLSAPSDADDHTAIYDISAHRVYLPNGQTLEAHSGFGNHLDDPRSVSEKDRGPTPPNVYDLSLREESFHGVRALRLTPVGNGNMFGRDGLLAHSYMLGPNGQSNGCVSFSDYPAFLKAYLGGDVTRLVVVDHLATAPSPRTASRGIAETIKAFFGRS